MSAFQKGKFTKIYQFESELENLLASEHYEEHMVKNIEKFYKKQKTTQLRKRNPSEFMQDKKCITLESDLLSISTQSDHNYDN